MVKTPKTVAVEQGLTNVSQALKLEGYQVVDLEKAPMDNLQCVVVSGSDENLMGIQKVLTKAPIINAEGLSAKDVVEQVNQYK